MIGISGTLFLTTVSKTGKNRQNLDHPTRFVRNKETPDREEDQCFRTSVKARDYDVYSCYSTVATKKTKKEGIINA